MSLYKPATGASPGGSQWTSAPNWYLWEGGFLAVGRSEGEVPPHAHHAIQIVISIAGQMGIRGKRGDWTLGGGIVVRPDVTHSYNGNGALGAMIFVDPESIEGVWLRSSLRDDITVVPDARVLSCTNE